MLELQNHSLQKKTGLTINWYSMEMIQKKKVQNVQNVPDSKFTVEFLTTRGAVERFILFFCELLHINLLELAC